MSYTIAGRVIKNEYLALGTLATTIGAAVGFSGGDSKKPTTGTTPVPVKSDPSIKSEDKDELDFIQQFVESAEKESKAAH